MRWPSHSPSEARNVGTPLSADTPAPVSTQTRAADRSAAAASSSAASRSGGIGDISVEDTGCAKAAKAPVPHWRAGGVSPPRELGRRKAFPGDPDCFRQWQLYSGGQRPPLAALYPVTIA